MKSHPQIEGGKGTEKEKEWWGVPMGCSDQFPFQVFRGDGGKRQKRAGYQVERERLGLEAAGAFLCRKV